MFRVDKDGYIRVQRDVLGSLQLVHLVSGLSDEVVPAGHRARIGTGTSGYTEWVTPSTPAISIGWEWVACATDGGPVPRRGGQPYGNVMIVDGQGQDLGADRSAYLLCEVADRLAWQVEVMAMTGHGVA